MGHGRQLFEDQDHDDDDEPSNHDHTHHVEHDAISVPSHVGSKSPCYCDISSPRKPNHKLSKEEREEKRVMKKRIKLQAKISSLHRTIRHAKGRKDSITESLAKKTLNDLVEKEHETIKDMQLDLDFVKEDPCSYTAVSMSDIKQRAKPIILGVSNALMKCPEVQGAHNSTTIGKDRQITEAVTLLKHMTKGTQQKDMFQETNALWGYTRQKFYERGLLVCTSLARIQVGEKDIGRSLNASTDEDLVHKEQLILRQKIWSFFESGLVRQCCSIGCGPGNDFVGLQTFLRLCSKGNSHALEKMILMDWSIDEWRGAVIDPLLGVLDNQGFNRNCIIQTVLCDVTKDLDDKTNHGAKYIFCEQSADFDMYLTSYLLSETRGKWFSFFKSVVTYAKGGSMFYFAEPVPWQLHRFIACFQGELEFLWLDSSMPFPSLQKADRRTGPAVLFAMKRYSSQDSIVTNTELSTK